jgi:uncharacterized membrane protein
MCRIRPISILGALLSMLLTNCAFAGMEFCNKTRIPLLTSVGYFTGSGWQSEGWWTIWPDNCSTVTSGQLTNRHYYGYATTIGDHFKWTGNGTFCIDPANAFTLLDSACNGRSGVESANFFDIDIGPTVLDKNTQAYNL